MMIAPKKLARAWTPLLSSYQELGPRGRPRLGYGAGHPPRTLRLRPGCSAQRVRVRLLRQHAEGLERQPPVRELGRLQQRVEVEGVEQHGLGGRQPAQLVERPVAQPQAQQGEAARARVGTLEGGSREERVEALAGRKQHAQGEQRTLSSRRVREARRTLDRLLRVKGQG